MHVSENIMETPEITVLGIGNIVLRDEGFGVRVVEALQREYRFPENVQVLDGGTLGMELLRFVTGTKKLLVIDSINGGAKPGTFFRFENDAVMAHFQDKLSVHEVGIQDVLALLTVTEKPIKDVVVIGAQPYAVEAGMDLTPEMAALMEKMKAKAFDELMKWQITPEKCKPEAAAAVTSL
ncbi:MAG: HyaD/HybD family hydrogenase maturation endopeptidase [Selenomonadaceae bacterium]